MARFWIFAAALNAFVAVSMGAFAAHWLEGRVSADALGWVQTGARYGLVHAVALLAVSLFAISRQDTAGPGLRYLPFIQSGLLFGCIVFSGTLYIMALTDLRFLGAVVPLGGMAFLVAWLALMLAGLRWGR
ncbi:DUF423 domain-containing protein [Denitrobaculum tricleocarpae]|uniref:DUF423 domain-containing protein n=1 Tax=Denitrobaculum tricleocarpae TaxID=2591009 RepID=A0A545TXM3_9PROT|nr:DUF423 domain-containing protein [Denitrobaculum tricleocarpae]TQV81975.1 DUF423 domain-containing protein [Denitrobaculum tricleocarpae]